MIPHTILDLESIALPEDYIRSQIPAFNADKVALGNRTKKDTIDAYIEECRKNHGNDIVERAALDPRYGQVAIAGLIQPSGNMAQLALGVNCETEADILKATWIAMDQASVQWESVTQADTQETYIDMDKTIHIPAGKTIEDFLPQIHSTIPILGFNIKGFDLPFMVARSLIMGVQVPASIWNPRHRYPFSDRVCDLMEVMSFGRKEKQYSSLDNALRMFGIAPNPYGDGSKFGEIWAADKAKALEYNAYDLSSEQQLAGKLGLN